MCAACKAVIIIMCYFILSCLPTTVWLMSRSVWACYKICK